MTNEDSFDVAIIGAGIAGLFAGCFLAKHGYKTAIYEAHSAPGGCAQGFVRKGFYFDAGAHLIGSLSSTGLFKKLLKMIDLEYNFIFSDPMDRLHFPNETISIPSGWKTYQSFLVDRFPQERQGIERLFSELQRIAKYAGKEDIADKYGPLSYAKLLDRMLLSDELKKILGAQWGFLGEVPEKLSSLSMAIMMVSYLRDGAAYAKGGTQRFCNFLGSRFRKFGGKLFLSTAIKDYELSENKITSLITANGRKIQARYFISTGYPNYFHHHFNLTRKDAKQIQKSISIYCAFFGLDLDPQELTGINGWYFFDRKALPEYPWIYVFSNTLFDKTLAPSGKSTLEAAFIYPKNLLENSDSALRKKFLRKEIMNFVSGLIPNLDNRIIVFEDGFPETFEKYTRNPDGAIYGWAAQAQNYFERKKLSKIRLFENLYFAGHWTMPGPGVPAVAASGYTAAKEVLEKLK